MYYFILLLSRIHAASTLYMPFTYIERYRMAKLQISRGILFPAPVSLQFFSIAPIVTFTQGIIFRKSCVFCSWLIALCESWRVVGVLRRFNVYFEHLKLPKCRQGSIPRIVPLNEYFSERGFRSQELRNSTRKIVRLLEMHQSHMDNLLFPLTRFTFLLQHSLSIVSCSLISRFCLSLGASQHRIGRCLSIVLIR